MLGRVFNKFIARRPAIEPEKNIAKQEKPTEPAMEEVSEDFSPLTEADIFGKLKPQPDIPLSTNIENLKVARDINKLVDSMTDKNCSRPPEIDYVAIGKNRQQLNQLFHALKQRYQQLNQADQAALQDKINYWRGLSKAEGLAKTPTNHNRVNKNDLSKIIYTEPVPAVINTKKPVITEISQYEKLRHDQTIDAIKRRNQFYKHKRRRKKINRR